MTTHQRQLAELRALCDAGRVARAVDLAFEHFARFGADAEVLGALLDAAARVPTAPQVAARLGELARVVDDRATSGTGSSPRTPG